MKWIKTTVTGAIVIGMAIALLLFSSNGSNGLAQDDAPIAIGEINYQNLETFIQTSPIPTRLPSILVYPDYGESTGYFYGDGGYWRDRYNQVIGYNVSIMDSPYCQQALSCTIAYATAEQITPTTQPLEVEYVWMMTPGQGLDQYQSHAGHAPGWIALSEGQPVYIVPWVNGGAGGGYEQILWDENGYRYTIALKWGEPAWLIQMVESIVHPG